MNDITLTDIVAYDNNTYKVMQIDDAGTAGNDGTALAVNWAIINNQYGTIEQLSFVLFQAIEVADQLKEHLDKSVPPTSPLTLVK